MQQTDGEQMMIRKSLTSHLLKAHRLIKKMA